MTLRGAAVLFLLVAAPLLQAQRLTFSDPIPLANTRYGAYDGQPRVETNGKDFFLFWQAENNLRVTRFVEGEQRVGRHVIATGANDRPAIAWTGTHFLVVSGRREVTGQLLDADAEPIGGPFLIFESGLTHAAASNGETVLLFHMKSSRLHASALTANGEPTGVSTAVMPTEDRPVKSVAVASDGDGYIALVSTSRGVLAVGYTGDGRERWRTDLHTTTVQNSPGEVGIASNGSAYLAAWQMEDGAGVQAVRIRANGTTNTTVTLEPFAERTSYSGPVGVVWTGAHWAVAYTIKGGNGQNGRLRVAYVHPTFPEIAARQEPGPGYDPALGVIDGRILLTWRPESQDAPAMAAILPVEEGEPEPVSFGAADQHLLATAAALDSTLAVWNESVDGESALRAGVRSADGAWVERHVSSQASSGGGVAASDGRDFVFAGLGISSPYAVFLDDTARVTLGPMPLPFRVFSIAWTGTDYVIAGTNTLARLSRNGTISARVTLRGFAVESVASNGTELMALLSKEVSCPFLCPDLPGELAFALLGPDLRPIGEPRFLDMKDAKTRSQAELAWDGTRFVMAWTVDEGVKVVELPAGEGAVRDIGRVTTVVRGEARIVAVEGGAAIVWRELREQDVRTRTRAALVREDEPIVPTTLQDSTNLRGEDPLIAALPDGAVGLFTSEPLYAAPHHGSMRAVLRVAMAPAAKPEPPHLTGVVREGRVELAWTAPPQDVGGYRIEYLIGSDGAWKEVDRWFDANDDAVTLSLDVQSGVPYQFRIRAFNEAGVSEYSAPVLVNVTRRRAVR